MATTRLSDIIEPEVFADYEAVDSPEKTALYTSGIVVRSEMLDAKANTGGSTIQVPFWNDLTQNEANISSDDPTTLSTHDKLTAGKQVAAIAYLNKSWSAADLANEIAGSSASDRIAEKVESYWTKQWQKRLIASGVGIIADNIANDAGDMVYDASIEDGDNAAAANLFNNTNFTNAAFTMGDSYSDIRGLSVHSVQYKNMTLEDHIEFIPDSQGTLTIPTYNGKVVVVDDGMPVEAGATSGFKYTAFLFGAGMFGFGEGTPEVPMEIERKPDGGNGGGIEVLYSRKTYLLHPFGFQFTEASVAGESATLAELQDAANWDRVVDRKNVPFAALITN